MFFNDRDTIIRLTPEWKGERLPDGRPKVSQDILRRMRNITFEEAWAPLWDRGYRNNWECSFKVTSPGSVLVGRAVTAVMVPKRPDLDQVLMDIGTKEEGHKGFFNQWVIDNLVEDDVVVVDLYDKIFEGTYVGGNLSTAIRTRTKTGGAVIWGGVRDLQQIAEMENFQIFYRGTDPTGIGNCSMTGYNMPCRIGQAICMPGDVVLGTISGVIFIPAHLAETVVVRAEKNHVRDFFGFDRLKSGTYTTAQIDRMWTVAMMEDFLDWFQKDPRADEYRHLTWEEEMDERFQDFEPQYDFDALMNRIVKVCQHPLWDYGDFVDNDFLKLMKFLDQVADQKTPLTIEKEGKYVYSGVYFCARRDRPVVFVHPFSANVQKGVVTQFYSETDGNKVTAIDLLTGAIESKNQYEWRVTKQKVKTTFMDIIEGLFGE